MGVGWKGTGKGGIRLPPATTRARGNLAAVFAKRKREKEAVRRFRQAIAAEWQSRGVVPRDASNDAFWEAALSAGLWNPEDPESRLEVNRLGMQLVDAAVA